MMALTLSSTSGNSDSPRKGGWRMRSGLISACLVFMALSLATEKIFPEQAPSRFSERADYLGGTFPHLTPSCLVSPSLNDKLRY